MPDTNFSNLIYNDNLVTGMYIENVLCSYDSRLNTYYSNSNNVSSISFFSEYDHLRYKASSMSDNMYSIYVYNDTYYDKLDLVVTDMPLINIYSLDAFDFDRYSINNLDVVSFNNSSEEEKKVTPIGISINNILQNNGKKSFSSSGVISQRGASSSFFSKKAYKIEMDERFGMYGVKDDNIWVLDALYTDESKVRNKLSSDLWNLFNDNQSINNDLECIFAEVFIDNEYVGLYTLKEKVDNSVTKNSDNGLLLKAAMHLWNDRIENFLQDPYVYYKNGNEMILNCEVKDSTRASLNNFIDRMHTYYSGRRDYDAINDVYYLNNFIDYKIFVAFIAGEDNITSNQYLSMIDVNSKVLLTPWDMDLTWGLYWELDVPLHSEFLMDRDYSYEWLESSIFNNLDSKTMSVMKKRYWELRKNTLTMDTINNYLDSYYRKLTESGAAKRDGERWYSYDLEFEINQIRDWASKRIDFLDGYFSQNFY